MKNFEEPNQLENKQFLDSINGTLSELEKIQSQKRMLRGKLEKARIENDTFLVEQLERQFKELK